MRAARISLEALLRARKLDNTLTSALPAPGLLPEHLVIPTGAAALDERLHGGVPRGQISEIVGPRSSGRASLLVAMLAGATTRGEIVALVDPLDMFDVASAAAGGVDLGRLLWIRGEMGTGEARRSTEEHGGTREGRRTVSQRATVRSAEPEPGATWSVAPWLRESTKNWERAVERAIKALNLVLQAGGFSLVALDLAEVPPPVVRRLPFTTWLRLQRVIEGSETVCVLLAAEPVTRSAGGVTMALRSRGQGPGADGQWLVAGGQRHARLFLGFDVEVSLSRARWPEATPCRFFIGGRSQ